MLKASLLVMSLVSRFFSSGTNQPAWPYIPVHDQSNSTTSASFDWAAPATEILSRIASHWATVYLTFTPVCFVKSSRMLWGRSAHGGISTVIVCPLMSSLVLIFWFAEESPPPLEHAARIENPAVASATACNFFSTTDSFFRP